MGGREGGREGRRTGREVLTGHEDAGSALLEGPGGRGAS